MTPHGPQGGRLLSTQEGEMAFSAFVGIVALLTTLVTGDLVQWPRPSVARHVVLLRRSHMHVVLRPHTGVGQLDKRERRATEHRKRLRLVLHLLL